MRHLVKFRIYLTLTLVVYCGFTLAEPPYVPNAVLQTILSDKGVNGFFHHKKAYVSKFLLETDPVAKIDKHELLFLNNPDSSNKRVFEVTAVNWNPADRMAVSFKYPVEGMSGQMTFHLVNEKWQLIKKEVVEN